MSQNYYDATGVLVFNGKANITPVIRALFGTFELDVDGYGDDKAYIALVAEGTSTSWESVADAIAEQAESLGIEISEEDDETDVVVWLTAIANKLDVDDPEFSAYLEKLDLDQDADVNAMFDLATWLNDGHNLKAIEIEGGWHSDKPRLFEFGGDGQYISKELYIGTTSTKALNLGRPLHAALLDKDFTTAGEILAAEVQRLLDGITNADAKAAVSEAIVAKLSA